LLFGNFVPTQERLGHRVDLIVVDAIRELRAFLDEVVHPGRIVRVGEVDPASINGLTAAARATLPPWGSTGRRPGIS